MAVGEEAWGGGPQWERVKRCIAAGDARTAELEGAVGALAVRIAAHTPRDPWSTLPLPPPSAALPASRLWTPAADRFILCSLALLAVGCGDAAALAGTEWAAGVVALPGAGGGGGGGAVGVAGKWETLRAAIAAHPPFAGDVFLRSRTCDDVESRGRALLKAVDASLCAYYQRGDRAAAAAEEAAAASAAKRRA